MLASVALAGCGDGGGGEQTAESSTASPVTATTAPAPPSGPMVEVCDRRLTRLTASAFRRQGLRGPLGATPDPSGTPMQSVCELEGDRAEASISLDAASDAPRRYRNRVTETAQFSGGDPGDAPHPVKGIGAPRLGAAGANWLPRIHLLLSVRGQRVLIVDVSAERLGDDALRDVAIQISLGAWRLLGDQGQ